MIRTKNAKKVLGLNERYLEYIRPFNLRSAIEIADDKVLTKQILKKNNIPTPEKLGLIRNSWELANFDFDSLPKSFVIKPVHGVRGGGVEIFYNKDKNGNWIKSDGSRHSLDSIKLYIRDILDGKFSLFNQPDVVLIEERIRQHKNLKPYSIRGAADVRVIVFNKIPVMSYVRFPTQESEGKANLDRGAIAAGIDMAVGKTTNAIIGKSRFIEKHPVNKLYLSGIKIPYWNKILKYAIEASIVTKLGFVAVDFLIDEDKGPLIIELNARPGLSIQLANSDGLRWRLKKASGIKVKTKEKGMRLAKDLFGGEIEEEIENISGKELIGIYEKVTLIGINENRVDVLAKIDTGADRSSIDEKLAIELGYGEIVNVFKNIKIDKNMSRNEQVNLMTKLTKELAPKYNYLVDVSLVHSSHGSSLRPLVEIKMKIRETTIQTKTTIYDRSKLTYNAIIGRKSLKNFIIDPSLSKKQRG
jgi:alpha-L-glutamate ligase-like protein